MHRNRFRPVASRARRASAGAIQRQAAEWLALRQARRLTLTEEADFTDWLSGDSRHASIYAEVEASWRAFDALAEYPYSSDAAPDPDLLARPRHTSLYRAPVLLAAAAAIAIVSAVWFKPWGAGGADFAPAAVAQIEPSLVRLPDGSEVEVNAGGEVREQFTADVRRVQLIRGEAHFIVAKNPARPFVVEANGVAIRAVGTAFHVRFQPDATIVEILVTEGTVQVSPPPPAVPAASADRAQAVAISAPPLVEQTAILTAGQRTIVSTLRGRDLIKPMVETLAADEIDRVLSWQTGQLILDATPLAEVVERFNRHAARRVGLPRLTVADPRLSEMKISGRVRPENIESFVEALEMNFDVVVERRTEREIVLKRR